MILLPKLPKSWNCDVFVFVLLFMSKETLGGKDLFKVEADHVGGSHNIGQLVTRCPPQRSKGAGSTAGMIRFSPLLYFRFILLTYGHLCAHESCVCLVPKEIREAYEIPYNQSSRWL